MRVIKRQVIWVLLIALMSLLVVSRVEAAQLQLVASDPVVLNQEFRVDLKLDPEADEINAIGGRLTWPSDLEVVAVLDGQSMVSLWTERPYYDGQQMIFSGVMPGGYKGSYSPGQSGVAAGVVFSVIAKPKRLANQLLNISELEVYPNDGSGELLTVAKPSLLIRVVPETDKTQGRLIENDKQGPQGLVASIESSPEVADGRWFVAFSAYDQGSGIKNFYIDEARTDKSSGNWLAVGSPFVLTDQTRSRHVLIKAVDWNDNESIISLPPLEERAGAEASRWSGSRLALLLIVMAGLAILIYLIKKIRRRYL